MKNNANESYTSLVSFQECTSVKHGDMLEINFEFVISIQDIRLPYHFFSFFIYLHVRKQFKRGKYFNIDNCIIKIKILLLKNFGGSV